MFSVFLTRWSYLIFLWYIAINSTLPSHLRKKVALNIVTRESSQTAVFSFWPKNGYKPFDTLVAIKPYTFFNFLFFLFFALDHVQETARLLAVTQHYDGTDESFASNWQWVSGLVLSGVLAALRAL